MKSVVALPVVAVLTLSGIGTSLATDLKDQFKLEIVSTGLQPDMDPGMYVCAGGHLHIKGTVQNLSDAPVGQIKIAGKVFDADGKLLGTASTSTKQPMLNPHEKADVNLEFLTVTGPLVKQVKNQELAVVAVAPNP